MPSMEGMNKLITILVLLLLLWGGCKKENMGDCFKSTGKIIETKRNVDAFHAIEIYDHINVYITYGTQAGIKVKAGENLLRHIETNVENGVLKISNENKCNWVRSFNKKIEVFISLTALNDLKFYGSGEIRLMNQLATDQLLVNLFDASGNVYLNVNTSLLELKSHTGTASIYARGACEEIVLFMGANGVIDAKDVIAQKALAVNENTGLLKVNARQRLTAEITGSGNIEYTGNPEIQIIQIKSGRLIKK